MVACLSDPTQPPDDDRWRKVTFGEARLRTGGVKFRYPVTGLFRLHAPRVYSSSRRLVQRTRRWFAMSERATAWASVAPTAMLGRNLKKFPDAASGTESSRRLALLAAGLPYRSTYLEIGVAHGATFEAVDFPFKWGVDPVPKFNTHLLPQGSRFACQTSDEFFSQLDPAVRFDLVFVDGLHEWHQTYTDVLNCIAHSHPCTVILLDDVIPADEFASWPDMDTALIARNRTGNMSAGWQGDVYKVLFAISDFHPELEFRVIHDGYNAQAVIWRKRGTAKNVQQRATADLYAEQTYSRVFADGLPPSWFGCMTEDDAVEVVHQELEGT